MVRLGARAKDVISGFTGIVTGRSTYLNGCVSVCISLEGLSKDGEPKHEWFDEQRIEVIVQSAFTPRESLATAGGPRDNPPRDGAL
jgi:hypothetical protein